MRDLLSKDKKAFQACMDKVDALAAKGHNLRRPLADYLRDKIYELRASRGKTHYRILYFFDARAAVVLTHGITKEGKVPDTEIDRAVKWRKDYLEDRKQHGVEVQL